MLVIRKKPSPVPDTILSRAFDQRFNRGKLEAIDPDAWVTRFHWKDRIRYTIVNPEVDSVWPVETAVSDDFNPRTRTRRILIAPAAAMFAIRRRLQRRRISGRNSA